MRPRKRLNSVGAHTEKGAVNDNRFLETRAKDVVQRIHRRTRALPESQQVNILDPLRVERLTANRDGVVRRRDVLLYDAVCLYEVVP